MDCCVWACCHMSSVTYTLILRNLFSSISMFIVTWSLLVSVCTSRIWASRSQELSSTFLMAVSFAFITWFLVLSWWSFSLIRAHGSTLYGRGHMRQSGLYLLPHLTHVMCLVVCGWGGGGVQWDVWYMASKVQCADLVTWSGSHELIWDLRLLKVLLLLLGRQSLLCHHLLLLCLCCVVVEILELIGTIYMIKVNLGDNGHRASGVIMSKD